MIDQNKHLHILHDILIHWMADNDNDLCKFTTQYHIQQLTDMFMLIKYTYYSSN